MNKERTVYLDYLRCLAAFMVMVLHISSESWYKLDGTSLDWNVLNIFNSMSRWSVPVFVMISGALLLPRQASFKSIYTKRILRLAVAYCVWSFFYALVVPLVLPDESISIKGVISSFISGKVHMWYIPMTIALYMCLPLIQPIANSKQLTKYFLLLSAIFSFMIPTGKNLSNDFIGGLFASGINALHGVVVNMNIYLVVGYTLYFIAGHAIEQNPLSKKQRAIIYAAGIAGFALTVVLTLFATLKSQKPNENYYSYFSVNVTLQALAVFTFFKYRNYPSEKLNRFVSKLSKLSFGAYLVHIFVEVALTKAGFTVTLFTPLLTVPVKALAVAILSFGISWLLSKIPFVNKWII